MTDAADRRTPLYGEHLAAGARIVPFAGWAMPVHYGSQIEEHHAVRRDVGIFDVSHMGQVFIEGPDALELAQRCVTRDVSSLALGAAAYAALVNEEGGMEDDLYVYHLAPGRVLLVVNAATYEKDVEILQAIAAREKLDARLIPAADEWAMIAVQGPRWREAVAAAIGEGPWQALEPFHIVALDHHGLELVLSTTGYTGEPGCEIMVAPNAAAGLWRALVAAGARPIGLAARDTLRLEQGFNLSGVDFTTAENPFEVRLAWIVQLDKPRFHGRDALARIKAEGIRRRQVGLLPEGRRIPRHGAAGVAGDRKIGEVTSGGFSPTLERPIVMALVEAEHAAPGTALSIDLGSARVAAAVTKLPFHKVQH